MTAAASRSPEPYEVPEDGLGSFLTATVGDWSDEALNADNYYDVVKPTADQLAQFGREEDDRIAHVATGETIIPMAVFEEDPALKEAVFNRMIDMGIDPERYIVGNELNSINPVTGQPEFFLKKIFKGIKKAVKGVVKVFKKVAPIVLSIGLSMVPVLGPILGTALGSGIGTLIQGGNFKDALKAAAIGGITAGVTSGIANVVKAQIPGGSPGGTFMEGVRGALPDFDKLSSTFSPATASTTASTAFTPEQVIAGIDGPPAGLDTAGMLASTTDPTVALGGQQGVDAAAAANVGPSINDLEEVLVTAKRLPPNTLSPAALAATTQPGFKEAVDQRQKLLETGTATYDELGTPEYQTKFERSKLGQARDYLTRSGMSPADIALEQTALENRLADKAFKKALAAGQSEASARLAAQAARESAKFAPTLFGSEFLAKYGPSALGITGLAAAAGAFEVPEPEPIDDMYGGITGMDLLAQNPLKYRTYAQRGAGYNPPPVGRS